MRIDLSKAIASEKRRVWGVVIGLAVVVGLLIWFGTSSSGVARQKVLGQSVLNLLNAESYHVRANLHLNLPVQLGNRERPIVDVAMKVEGDVLQTGERPELTGDLLIEAKGRGMVLFADGDVRLLHDAVAFRLENLPALLNPRGNLVEKWTYVEVPVLETRNREAMRTALVNVLQGMEFVGEEDSEAGEELWRYQRDITAEQEQVLIDVFRQGQSGNRGSHVLARLMRAYDVELVSVWIDEDDRELRAVEVSFIDPDNMDAGVVATVDLQFSEYGKDVQIERPEKELTVRPEVFGQVFGRGEIEGL